MSFEVRWRKRRVRAHHRDHGRRGLRLWHRVYLPIAIISPLLLLPPALAAPPLLLAADIGEPGLRIWWRSGELLVGNTEQSDRPGLKPLVSDAPMVLPADLTGWSPVGETCQDPPRATLLHKGQSIVASVVTDPAEQQWVRLTAGDRVIAENTLGRPVSVCEIRVVDADLIPGPEVLIAWRFEDISGLTVFRIPDTALY